MGIPIRSRASCKAAPTGNIDISSKDNDGRTALSRASERGHKSTAELHLTAGDIDRRETSKPASQVQLDKPTPDQTAEYFRLSVD
jgi:ankyrin repeat protein